MCLFHFQFPFGFFRFPSGSGTIWRFSVRLFIHDLVCMNIQFRYICLVYFRSGFFPVSFRFSIGPSIMNLRRSLHEYSVPIRLFVLVVSGCVSNWFCSVSFRFPFGFFPVLQPADYSSLRLFIIDLVCTDFQFRLVCCDHFRSGFFPVEFLSGFLPV